MLDLISSGPLKILEVCSSLLNRSRAKKPKSLQRALSLRLRLKSSHQEGNRAFYLVQKITGSCWASRAQTCCWSCSKSGREGLNVALWWIPFCFRNVWIHMVAPLAYWYQFCFAEIQSDEFVFRGCRERWADTSTQVFVYIHFRRWWRLAPPRKEWEILKTMSSACRTSTSSAEQSTSRLLIIDVGCILWS